MLPNGVFEMPFCIKMLSNICEIRTISYISAKVCVVVLPRGGTLGLQLMTFCPEGCGFAGFFVRKKFPGGGPSGLLTAGVD